MIFGGDVVADSDYYYSVMIFGFHFVKSSNHYSVMIFGTMLKLISSCVNSL